MLVLSCLSKVQDRMCSGISRCHFIKTPSKVYPAYDCYTHNLNDTELTYLRRQLSSSDFEGQSALRLANWPALYAKARKEESAY